MLLLLQAGVPKHQYDVQSVGATELLFVRTADIIQHFRGFKSSAKKIKQAHRLFHFPFCSCICRLLAGPFSALLLLLLLVIHFKFIPRQNYCSNHMVASMHLKSEATGFSIDSLLFTQFARLFIVRSMLR